MASTGHREDAFAAELRQDIVASGVADADKRVAIIIDLYQRQSDIAAATDQLVNILIEKLEGFDVYAEGRRVETGPLERSLRAFDGAVNGAMACLEATSGEAADAPGETGSEMGAEN